MPYFSIRPFEKALLDSIRAALRSGPKHLIPAASIASTRPPARGSSGVTTQKSMPRSRAVRTVRSLSIGFPGRQRASSIPGLPGRANTPSARGLLAICLTTACSLPPEPITRTLMPRLLFGRGKRRMNQLTAFIFLLVGKVLGSSSPPSAEADATLPAPSRGAEASGECPPSAPSQPSVPVSARRRDPH